MTVQWQSCIYIHLRTCTYVQISINQVDFDVLTDTGYV